MVERELDGDSALLCDALGVYWCVRSDATLGQALGLSLDAEGGTRVLTALEALVAELEAELRRR